MKKQKLGFAFLLLGIIFAVSSVPFSGWLGIMLGINGLVLVISDLKEN